MRNGSYHLVFCMVDSFVPRNYDNVRNGLLVLLCMRAQPLLRATQLALTEQTKCGCDVSIQGQGNK